MQISKTVLAVIVIMSISCAVPTDSKIDQLNQIYDEAWQFRLEESPTFATRVGVHEFDDRLSSMAIEDIERRHEKNKDLFKQLLAIDPVGISRQDQINYQIFEQQLSDRISEFEYKSYLFPLTSETGFHTGFARLPEWVPLNTVQDYENYLARLKAYSEYTDQHIALLQEGLESGMVLQKVVLEGYESTIQPHIVDRVEETSRSWTGRELRHS